MASGTCAMNGRQRPATSGPRGLALRALVLLAFAPPAAGCAGYQIGPRALFPPHIHTVYVPVFESDSYRRQLSERLTEAVVRQIEQQTPYKVVASSSADSVLSGRIVSARKRVISENANDVPRDLETEFLVQVNWYDQRGAAIVQPTVIPLASLNVTVAQSANFIPEGGQSLATAQQEAINRVARQIVWQMESEW